MPSTYTGSLGLELQANGENNSTWGTKANTVFSLLEEATSGYVSVAIAGSTALTITDGTASSGATDQARKAFIKLTGTPGAGFTLTLPEVEKSWVLWNATDGTATIQTGTATATVVLPVGQMLLVQSDGAGSVLQVTPNMKSDGVLPSQAFVPSDGTVGQVLTTDGAGSMYFATASGSGDVLESQLTWQVKTGAYTAVNLDRILADTSGAAFSVTLPATPTTGAEVRFADPGASWATNNLTINGNGNNIDGAATFSANVNSGYFTAVYDATEWVVRFAGGAA